MSGGSYNHTYLQIEEMASSIPREPELARRFAEDLGYDPDIEPHYEERELVGTFLKKVADLCKTVEYIDSGDKGQDDWSEVLDKLEGINVWLEDKMGGKHVC